MAADPLNIFNPGIGKTSMNKKLSTDEHSIVLTEQAGVINWVRLVSYVNLFIWVRLAMRVRYGYNQNYVFYISIEPS
ncbi:hypothetical protein D3C85_1451020 [compost metagenome]